MEKERYLSLVHSYLHLLSLYLNKKEAHDFNIDEQTLSFFIKLSKRHSLTAFLYKALTDTKVDVNKDILKTLEEYYYGNLRKDVIFEKERKVLFEYLKG